MLANPPEIATPPQLRHRRGADALIAALLLVSAWAFYRQWPRAQVTDSRYALLLSETIASDHTVYLDRHFQPPLDPERFPGSAGASDPAYQAEAGYPYQIEVLPPRQGAGRVLLWYPNFPSLLALPAVAVMHAAGLRTLAADGRYDPQAELTMQLHLGAALTALAVALAYWLARIWLSRGRSVAVAVAFAVASPLWSTSSRAMWTSTWGIVLQLLLWGMLLRVARPRDATAPRTQTVALAPHAPWWVGTLCAWLYLCRPALAVEVLAVMAWLTWLDRRSAFKTALVGALWAALFAAWSWNHGGHVLPSYYRHTGLRLGHVAEGLYGSLLSPGRGLLVYTPWLLAALWALAATWRRWRPSWRRPDPLHAAVVVALCATLGHAAMLACYPNWWGGHSYGARLMVDTLPLTVLWGAAAWGLLQPRWPGDDGARATAAVPTTPPRALRAGIGLLAIALVVVAVWIHWRGVTDRRTFRWNSWPSDINDDHRRALDWRLPQFMVGLLPQPPPEPMPAVAWGQVLKPGRREGQLHLLDGWSDAEGEFRWTEGAQARFCAQLPDAVDHQLALTLRPYLDARPLPRGPVRQRLLVSVGGRLLATWVLDKAGFQTVRLDVPAAVGRDVDVQLQLPDASAPAAAGDGTDARRLGVAVHAIRWLPRGAP